jgi:hypothetical protein
VSKYRRGVAWGSATTVVLAAISAALINELHGGWGWWVAAIAVVAVSATYAGWLATRSASGTADTSNTTQTNAVGPGGTLYTVQNGNQVINHRDRNGR